MAKLLEELDPGTPLRCDGGPIAGEVRAVYSTGESRGAEFISVFWTARGEETLVPAAEVLTIENGIVVLRSSLQAYSDLAAVDPAKNPLLHRLR